MTKAVALVGDLEKLVSINFFRRRFGGLTAGEMCIHFSHWVCPCQANQKSPFAVEQALLDGCQWFTFLTDQRRAIVDITPVTLSPIETVISASSGR